MYSDLEAKYDVVITGTDMVSSLLAGAIGRIGKSVLHIDSMPRYGKEWRAMRLFDLLLWKLNQEIDCEPKKDEKLAELSGQSFRECIRPKFIHNIDVSFPVFENIEECKKFIQLTNSKITDDQCKEMFEDFHQMFYSKLKTEPEMAAKHLDELKEKWHQFNRLDISFTVDLCPRLLLSYGPMVETLIRSNVTRYLNFKRIVRILTPVEKKTLTGSRLSIVNVPFTKSDIFKSKIITMIEKRYLMRFLQFCFAYKSNSGEAELSEELKSKSFDQYLQLDQQMTPRLTGFIVNSLLMEPGSITTDAAMEKIKKIVDSIGRFTDRPYICPMYGSEEILQAFCRYAAIYGVTYCLNSPIRGVTLEDQTNRITSLITENFRVDCDHLITDYRVCKYRHAKPNPVHTISRAIICSCRSISSDGLSVDEENTSVLYLPPDITGHSKPIYVFESDRSTRVCPAGLYIQYYWCEATNRTARDDLRPIVQRILNAVSYFDEDIPAEDLFHNPIIWSVYFNQKYSKLQYEDGAFPANVHSVSPPQNELDYDAAVGEARRIFEEIFPEEKFFPPTEEPESQSIGFEF